MPFLLAAALVAAPVVHVPHAALYDETPHAAVSARPEPPGEPARGVVEYVAALAAFTLLNSAGAAMLENVHLTVAHGDVNFNGTEPQLALAAGCFALSPLAAALTSWMVGRGSSSWDPSLGWTTVGAYGTSLLAVGAGVGIAAANIDRTTAQAANVGLYLAVPLGTVLVQNATKSPLP